LDKTVEDGKTYAVIQVANSGKGVSDEDIKHIFERFYQVDSQAVGSGIGLALSKAMVELHGGDISVNNEEAGWTKFTVRIPFFEYRTNTGLFDKRNQTGKQMRYFRDAE
jgi:signal transduction histidine kinase